MTRTIIAVLIVVSFSFSIIAPVSAQSIAVLGEVKANGKVFIQSTAGQWLAAPSTYPLLQKTGIRTDDGSAALYFKEGSRIEIAKNSLAVVDGSSSQYTVHMSKGTLAFNMVVGATLSVQTASASVSVNKISSVVQKVSLEKSGRVLGIISSTAKGTEVRCISGRIAIDVTPTETKLISSGESIFVDMNSSAKVYNTQSNPQVIASNDNNNQNNGGNDNPSFNNPNYAWVGGFLVLAGGAASLAYTSRNKGKGFSSPSFP